MIFKPLQKVIKTLVDKFDSIDVDRQEKLKTLSNYIAKKFQKEETPKLIVICTHNSRRSHLGQLWLAIASDYFELDEVKTYSGGTEATAFNPNAVKALKDIGVKIETTSELENPIYQVQWKNNQKPYEAFSKCFEDTPNPTEAFSAIMVCSEADEGCPFVPGTDFRIALPFEDPKAFDNTPQQAEKYKERCLQIGTEMLFVMQQVKASFT